MLAFSEACERNKGPILGLLRDELAGCTRVLEIGSGTGQHAVHFARHLRHLEWQPTDRADYLRDLAARIAEEGTPNLLVPLELDVLQEQWPPVAADAVYSANTLHIMSWPEVEAFFSGVRRVLPAGGVLVAYGPFRYAGNFTSESNAAFDRSLRERDPASGIRDIEAVNRLAEAQGMMLMADHSMPANNRLLLWIRGGSGSSRGAPDFKPLP
jgi:cyclopropane fatty-acyl-phospholipid synthase-like methyltransferase